MNTLEIKAGIQVAKPINEVYDAIINPDKMKNYFISKSSGIIEENKIIQWGFPEMDMLFDIRVGKLQLNKYISYYWKDLDGTETFVEFFLESKESSLTYVKVTEKERTNDDEGINWLKRNTEGWANFLACLKAWMEYNINLRKNAFNISQIPT
jgi:uncharacterized protein YndB with AHSA1/START domain